MGKEGSPRQLNKRDCWAQAWKALLENRSQAAPRQRPGGACLCHCLCQGWSTIGFYTLSICTPCTVPDTEGGHVSLEMNGITHGPVPCWHFSPAQKACRCRGPTVHVAPPAHQRTAPSSGYTGPAKTGEAHLTFTMTPNDILRGNGSSQCQRVTRQESG